MGLRDDRGYEITGASPSSLLIFEKALRLFQSWRADPLPAVGEAIGQSPMFVMAHVLRSYIYLCSRELANVKTACDYLLGNTGQLRDRVSRLVPLWSADMPGYSAFAAMYGFGLAENGHLS